MNWWSFNRADACTVQKLQSIPSSAMCLQRPSRHASAAPDRSLSPDTTQTCGSYCEDPEVTCPSSLPAFQVTEPAPAPPLKTMSADALSTRRCAQSVISLFGPMRTFRMCPCECMNAEGPKMLLWPVRAARGFDGENFVYLRRFACL